MILVLVSLAFIDPIISPHFVALGLPETYGGYCLGVEGGTHFLGAIIVGNISGYRNNQIILFALLTSTISILAIGPSQLIGLNASAAMTLLGVASNGFFTSFIEVLTIPILITAIEVEEGENLTQKKKNQIADKAATLYMIAIGLGSLIGPVIGGGLSDLAGF